MSGGDYSGLPPEPSRSRYRQGRFLLGLWLVVLAILVIVIVAGIRVLAAY